VRGRDSTCAGNGLTGRVYERKRERESDAMHERAARRTRVGTREAQARKGPPPRKRGGGDTDRSDRRCFKLAASARDVN